MGALLATHIHQDLGRSATRASAAASWTHAERALLQALGQEVLHWQGCLRQLTAATRQKSLTRLAPCLQGAPLGTRNVLRD
jgi:hypothetical protein